MPGATCQTSAMSNGTGRSLAQEVVPPEPLVVVAVEHGAGHKTGDAGIRSEITVDGMKQVHRAQLKMQEGLSCRLDAVEFRPAFQKVPVGIVGQPAHGEPWRIGHKPVEVAGQESRPVCVAQDERPDAVAPGNRQFSHAMRQREQALPESCL